MELLDNIDYYFTYLKDEKSEFFVGSHNKEEFINASNLLIFNNNNNLLNELLINSNCNTRGRIQLKHFISSRKVHEYLNKVDDFKDQIANECEVVKDKVCRIIKTAKDTDKNILKSVSDHLLKLIINQKFNSERIKDENGKDFIYIFNRLDEEQKENLVSIIDNYYRNLTSMINDFKTKSKKQ